MKKAAIGIILIIIGLLLAPTGMPDDAVTTVPMILVFGLQTYMIIAIIGYVLIIVGLLLAGHSAYKYLGPLKAVFKNPILIIAILLLVVMIIMTIVITYMR